MSRTEIVKEIETTLGLVPTMFKSLPDSTLELEWNLFKAVQLSEGVAPNKYKELIGVGIAAATKCRYCILFHTASAKLNGATDAEIEEALEFAKATSGWSAYVNGLQIDFEQFRKEIAQMVRHVKARQLAASKETGAYKGRH